MFDYYLCSVITVEKMIIQANVSRILSGLVKTRHKLEHVLINILPETCHIVKITFVPRILKTNMTANFILNQPQRIMDDSYYRTSDIH